MSLKELKTVKITSKGQIAIPKEIRKIKGFEEGSRIALFAFDDHIEMRPLKQIKKTDIERVSSYIMSESSLAKDWLAKEEDEAWKNL